MTAEQQALVAKAQEHVSEERSGEHLQNASEFLSAAERILRG
jgi:hypothetical protein